MTGGGQRPEHQGLRERLRLPAPGADGARRRRLTRRSLTVGVVAILAGALLATNAALFRASGERTAQDLPGLVAAESGRLDALTGDVEALRREVASLIELESGAPTAAVPQPELDLAAGGPAVEGPGLVVRLWDAPVDAAPAGARPDDLVVHQQDLEAVMNALWAGGAEAMTIQGNRVTSWTALRCVGTVLLMAGRTYSPPYEVAAIGDPQRLRDALDAAPGVQVYRQYVDAVGLGWSVQEQSAIEMPEAVPSHGLEHARVPTDAPAASGPPSGSEEIR